MMVTSPPEPPLPPEPPSPPLSPSDGPSPGSVPGSVRCPGGTQSSGFLAKTPAGARAVARAAAAKARLSMVQNYSHTSFCSLLLDSYPGLVLGEGFEPPYYGSKPSVLPLDDPRMGNHRVDCFGVLAGIRTRIPDLASQYHAVRSQGPGTQSRNRTCILTVSE